MFAWTSHGTELKRFARKPITRAAIAVMLLIPLLYGAMYVWAFWDPTIHMGKLPVALVNADTGATRDGASVHYGQDVVDNLVDRGALDSVLPAVRLARPGDHLVLVVLVAGIDGDGDEREAERRAPAQDVQHLQERPAVLATGQADHHPISRFDHLVLDDRPRRLLREACFEVGAVRHREVLSREFWVCRRPGTHQSQLLLNPKP